MTGNVLGAPQATGIVVELVNITPNEPNSGQRKCAKVQLIKNEKIVLAYIPHENGARYIDVNVRTKEHTRSILTQTTGYSNPREQTQT